ncbi:MAG TPA: hypothetical protein VIL36_13055, partial [Acidimicrobiales bacterium]
MGNGQRRRRRIDRLTADDFLDGLSSRSIAEIRAMRDDCREEEAHLSYTRRLLQARLDIARAERARRQGGGEGSLIDELPRILADGPSNRPRHGGPVPLYAPESKGRRREDAVLEDASMGLVVDLDDTELDAYLERIEAEERQVSERRRVLLRHLDELQAELVRRL